MRPLEQREKESIYKFSKGTLFAAGIFLVAFGCWYFVAQLIAEPQNLGYWFGVFPAYLGAMMILFGFAMKLEWFTDARRFW
ncbi:MAG: hypothetical protein JRN20_07960 [Nitrososphaerota archaeon]|nr:hypothetical protein [Nitrososphaerota archaeon]